MTVLDPMSVMSDWWPAVLLLAASIRPFFRRLPARVSPATERTLPLRGRWLHSLVATATAILAALLIPLGYLSGVWLADGMSLARHVLAGYLPLGLITWGGYRLAASWTPRAGERRERWLPIPREYLFRICTTWLALMLTALIFPVYGHSNPGGWRSQVGWKSFTPRG